MDPRIVEAIAALEREGSLTASQREQLEQRLDEALAPRDRGARFAAVVGALGATLIAAGVLYLVGYNWDELSKPLKLTLVFGLWAGVHAAAGWCSLRPGRYPQLGTALTVLGVLCFGAAIGLVAQIYHLVSHYPNAVLAWWALNVPLLLWSRSRAVQVAVTGLFLVWCFWHFGVYAEHVNWVGLEEHGILAGTLIAGLALLGCGLAECATESAWECFAGLWRGLAWLALIVAPFVLGFEDLWIERRGTLFANIDAGLHATRPLHAFALAALLGAGLLAARWWRTRTFTAPVLVALSIGSALALALLIALAPFSMPVTANVVLLTVLVLTVRAGTRQGRPGLVNLAVAAFCVALFARYVEHLWDKLEGAYAFLTSGALLLGLGWFLEHRRRRWTAQAKEATP